MLNCSLMISSELQFILLFSQCYFLLPFLESQFILPQMARTCDHNLGAKREPLSGATVKCIRLLLNIYSCARCLTLPNIEGLPKFFLQILLSSEALQVKLYFNAEADSQLNAQDQIVIILELKMREELFTPTSTWKTQINTCTYRRMQNQVINKKIFWYASTFRLYVNLLTRRYKKLFYFSDFILEESFKHRNQEENRKSDEREWAGGQGSSSTVSKQLCLCHGSVFSNLPGPGSFILMSYFNLPYFIIQNE